jgi:hypothetical protein
MTRGIKNNNIGNLFNTDDWEGLDVPRSDAALYPGRTPSLRFIHLFYGARAAGIDVFGDILVDGLDTPRKMFKEYAPLGDEHNDPLTYAAFVAHRLGIGIDEKIVPEKHGVGLLRAICKFENGEEVEDAYPPHGYEVVVAAVDVALAHLKRKVK